MNTRPRKPDDALPRWLEPAVLGAAAIATVVGSIGFLAGGPPLGDDISSHFSEIDWVANRLGDGTGCLWFDRGNTGYPLFLAYPPLATLLMGALTALTSGVVSPLFTFKSSVVLAWAAMPAAWALGGRWLGLSRGRALVFGLLILAVSDWRDFGLTLESMAVNGLYTQTLGMLLFPLVVGRSFRAVVKGDGGALVPGMLLALQVLTHAYLGMYASIAVVIMAATAGRDWPRASLVVVRIAAVGAVLSAFWWIPFLLNGAYGGGLPWKNESENGYPLGEWLGTALSGRWFDDGRVPWLSLLVVIGLAQAVRGVVRRRADPLDRWVVSLLAVTLLLFLGPTNLGAWYRRLPLHGELEVIRYLSGVQFCGLILASGVLSAGLAAVVPAGRGGRRVRVAGLILAASFLTWHGSHTSRVFGTFPDGYRERVVDFIAEEAPPSRFWALRYLDGVSHFDLNLMPVLTGVPQVTSYSRGYHDTLTVYYLDELELSPALFKLLNVKFALASKPLGNSARAQETERVRDDGAGVYEVGPDWGYFDVVRTPLVIRGDSRSVRPYVKAVVDRGYRVGILPELDLGRGAGEAASARLSVAQDGGYELVTPSGMRKGANAAAAVGQLASLFRPARPAGAVIDEDVAVCRYGAVVDAGDEGARAMLKVSYHPYWRGRVDDAPSPVRHLGPNFMGVDVPPGRHRVDLTYALPAWQPMLAAATALLWLALTAAAAARGRVRNPGFRDT